ncbi:MAG: GNAT family N-acetyltransferase [Granulosicoccus sp.]
MSTNAPDVKTCIASREDVHQLIRWAADEGWNPGLEDDDLFYMTDSAGFFVSTINKKVVAGISLVKHTDEQSFLGLYLCAPEHRAKGIGLATWLAALDTIENHAIGLDGVADQQENYRKSGFVYHFGNQRYAGALTFSDQDRALTGQSQTVQIHRATGADLDSVVTYDASIGGFERLRFFRAWMHASRTRTLFVARSGDLIVGVIGIRKCHDGHKIGPWLAESPFIATQLLHAVSDMTKHESVMIDIPDVNTASLQIAEALGMQPMFDTARMYRGAAPAIDTGRLFGVATLELG